jgi:hypothetical protein
MSIIISEQLKPEVNSFIDHLFKEIGLEPLLKKNAWIGGGFARIVARNNFGIKSSESSCNFSILDYLVLNNGDIDIFTTSKSNIPLLKNLIKDDKAITNDYYSSVFADTYVFNKYDPSINNGYNYYRIAVQIINKFFYENINKSLEDFDFTNCKFALELKDNKYYIHYDKNALEYEKQGKLNIEHCKSPLLGRRIIKYIKEKGLRLNENKQNLDILREYYYKVVTRNWDDVFKNNMPNDNFSVENLAINRLERFINMSKEDLVLFIGTLSIDKYETVQSGYGSYHYFTGSYDWATNLLTNV